MNIRFVLGCNLVGKSTLMNVVKTDCPDNFGVVEVGRMMREKYHPSHFKGQNNPAHAAQEAWKMMLDGIGGHFVSGKKSVFVDGQPRDIKQATECLRLFPNAVYLHLFASDETRKERLQTRDGSDPEKMALSQARFDSDAISNYKVLCCLMDAGATIITRKTDDVDECTDGEYTFFYQEIISSIEQGGLK